MILAAGFGTRLGALSRQMPKPMLPICGVPLVRWCVLWLHAQGVREIVINLHHKGEAIEADLGDGSQLGVQISYSKETTILGTGGGLRQARSLLDDGSDRPILVLNGKLMFELALDPLIEQHNVSGAEATMVLRRDTEGIWGSGFGLDDMGRVTTFLGRAKRQLAAPELMFTGIQLISPRFLRRIPATGASCIVRTAYAELFEETQSLFGYRHGAYWWEHSTVDRYLHGIRNVLDGRIQLPFAPFGTRGVHRQARVHTSAVIRDPVWIGPRAEVQRDATVGPHVQLGAGSRVKAGCHIRNTAVWDRATVTASIHDEVVTR